MESQPCKKEHRESDCSPETVKKMPEDSDTAALKKFFCPCCNVGYTTSEAMIQHIKQSPIKVKTFNCHICLLEFFVKSDLMDHQRLDHQIVVHKKYKCDECELDYTNLAQLNRHKKMHAQIAQKLAASGIVIPRPPAESNPSPVLKEEPKASAVPKPDSPSPPSPPRVPSPPSVTSSPDATPEPDLPPKPRVQPARKNKKKAQDSREKESKAAPAMKVEERLEECDSAQQALDMETDDADDENDVDWGRKWKTTGKRKRGRPRKRSLAVVAVSPKSKKMKKKKRKKRKRQSTPPPQDTSETEPIDLDDDLDTTVTAKTQKEVFQLPPSILNEDGSIRCPDCDVMCSSLNGLNRHRNFHFKTMDKLKCVFCDDYFSSRTDMGSHMTEVHPLKKCQKAYLLPRSKKHPCQEPGCTQVFSAPATLTRHVMKVHGLDRYKINSCGDCGKQFPTRSALTVHRRMHTDERPFKCDLCPKEYRASSSLVLHRKSHGDKKPFVCEYCGKGFTCPNSLRRHVRCRHTGEKPYMCDVCGSTFTDHNQLLNHSKAHGHGKLSVPGQYACDLCHKRFRTQFGINSHRQRCVHGRPGGDGSWKPKPVICEVCGREFPSKINLKNHMVTHTDERPHKCRFCEATFRHYKSKYSHEKMHKGQKDFICSMCGKAFYQRINLKTHMTSHNEVKDLACRLCGKKFNSEHNRKRHEKRCMNYLKCPVCSAIFRVHHRLVRHMNLNHHGMMELVSNGGGGGGVAWNLTANPPVGGKGNNNSGNTTKDGSASSTTTTTTTSTSTVAATHPGGSLAMTTPSAPGGGGVQSTFLDLDSSSSNLSRPPHFVDSGENVGARSTPTPTNPVLAQPPSVENDHLSEDEQYVVHQRYDHQFKVEVGLNRQHTQGPSPPLGHGAQQEAPPSQPPGFLPHVNSYHHHHPPSSRGHQQQHHHQHPRNPLPLQQTPPHMASPMPTHHSPMPTHSPLPSQSPMPKHSPMLTTHSPMPPSHSPLPPSTHSPMTNHHHHHHLSAMVHGGGGMDRGGGGGEFVGLDHPYPHQAHAHQPELPSPTHPHHHPHHHHHHHPHHHHLPHGGVGDHINSYGPLEQSRFIASSLSAEIVKEVYRNYPTTYLF